ncbi:nitric oxide reductase activation protein NorD [Longimicrobium sp.]|uniref:nitric oxide reductase activation protein NorD n=1 Tax=Longimicrobium sp. TaxID=2029185 RepID=UPI003B3A25C4
MPPPTGLAGRGRALLRRWRPAPQAPVLRLDDVRRRLEILIAAVYGRSIPIVATAPPERTHWTRRLFFPEPGHLRRDELLAAADAERVHLPPQLDASEGEAAALARYRLLAIAQAERIARGTPLFVPDLNPRWNRHLVAAGALTNTENPGPIRDLYVLLEGAAVDAAIARAVPGLAPALHAERARALASRPDPDALTPAERKVEALARRLLELPPGEAPPELQPGATPAESLQRARALAAELGRGRYRGIAGVAPWGAVLRGLPPGAMLVADLPPMLGSVGGPGMAGVGISKGQKEEKGKTAAVSPLALDQDKGKAADPAGDDRMDPERADGDASAEPAEPVEGQEGGEHADGAPAPGSGALPAVAGGGASSAPAAEGGTPYPEWDHSQSRYRPRAAVVRMLPAALGDEGWATALLARHGPLVRRLRERFERMRAQRTRLMQQRRGDELDLAACVRAMVDLRTGHSPDDRLYADVRPARRGLAITLLVDISGSTDEFVGQSRIIDIEKTALLLTSEALDALGDVYSILTFSGVGAGDVRLRTLKDFGEHNGKAVRQRIAALKPEGYTRMGAAIRHAVAQFSRTASGHRLLLILSDGKPNDQDHYQGLFAIEDARQAIAEARAAGVHPFCLTVDRKGSSYLTRIFGASGHVVLRQPDQLPMALVGVVRQILASG